MLKVLAVLVLTFRRAVALSNKQTGKSRAGFYLTCADLATKVNTCFTYLFSKTLIDALLQSMSTDKVTLFRMSATVIMINSLNISARRLAEMKRGIFRT